MIQSNELRIGNFVKFNAFTLNQRMQIDEIDFEDVLGGYFTDIEPIPLTEEWHLKFGAEKVEIEVYCYVIPTKRSVNIEIRFNDADVYMYQGDDIILVWDYDYALRGMYVHEWQNLYFALKGEELTIKN